jgi:hypothetical protein
MAELRWALYMRDFANWTSDALELICHAPCGYRYGSTPAAEPTALAAIALLGAKRFEDAQPHLQWLAANQGHDGCVSPLGDLKQPGWPTPLAIVAFAAAQSVDANARLTFDIEAAKRYLLSISGKTLEPSPQYGHNGQLVGWPWVDGTHSWQEPTATAVLALKSIGLWDHPRTREGVRLLIDRLLMTGGCNYGNTVVLGQKLRPHVEPTGIALVALAGEKSDDPRIERSVQYLTGVLNNETTPISLSYGLLGLAAHDRTPDQAANWLQASFRQIANKQPSPLDVALLSLAAQGSECPLIALTKLPSAAAIA